MARQMRSAVTRHPRRGDTAVVDSSMAWKARLVQPRGYPGPRRGSDVHVAVEITAPVSLGSQAVELRVGQQGIRSGWPATWEGTETSQKRQAHVLVRDIDRPAGGIAYVTAVVDGMSLSAGAFRVHR